MFRIIATVAAVILMMPIFCAVNAQQFVDVKSAVLQYAEGEVFLDGRPVEIHDGIHILVEGGHRLETKKGRGEFLLPFYTYVRMGENSSLRITGTSFNDMETTLERGACLIEVLEAPSGNRIRVRILESVVEIEKEGLYRLDSDSGELRVHNGEVKVTWGKKKVKVKKDRMVPLAALSRPEKFETNICDPLHRWAAQRSFVLFIAPGPRGQEHWVLVSPGWMRHPGYRMKFYSELVYWQYFKKRAQDKLRKLHLDSDIYTASASYRTSYLDLWMKLNAEISEAERNAQRADPTVWKEDPALSGCD